MKQRVVLAFVSLCISLLSGQSWAGEADAFFVKANEAYQKGDYSEAVRQYQKILELGVESWEVYYNMGNAYFKQGHLAKAILNFERAKRLAPQNEDVLFNLELANLSTADRIQQLPEFLFSAWLRRLAEFFGIQTLTYASLTAYLLLMAILIMRTLRPKLKASKAMLVSHLTAGIALAFFAGLMLYSILVLEAREEAVVLAVKTEVMSAPSDSGTELFTLHEGAKVEIRDRSGGWCRIRLADGKVGWLRTSDVEVI